MNNASVSTVATTIASSHHDKPEPHILSTILETGEVDLSASDVDAGQQQGECEVESKNIAVAVEYEHSSPIRAGPPLKRLRLSLSRIAHMSAAEVASDSCRSEVDGRGN